MTIVHADDWLTVHAGDCRDVLATLPERSVHCVVTSPPYWGLRDYGTATWDGGDAGCSHRIPATGSTQNKGNNNREGKPFDSVCGKCGAIRQDRQLGLEPTPEAYVANMVDVFRAVRRVLRDDGTLWLNLGDSYAGSGMTGGTNSKDGSAKRGMKPKDLVGIPWRVAFALQADGWYLRSDIIWAKPNPMPESVTDRPTKSHEYVFLLAKSERYYFDADAVREPLQSSPSDLRKMVEGKDRIGGLVKEQDDPLLKASGRTNIGRKRSVGNPAAAEAALRKSGNLERKYGEDRGRPGSHLGANVPWEDTGSGRNIRSVWTIATQPYPGAHFATFPPKLVEPCILAGSPAGGTVLDPFGGSGTTAMVAQHLSRRAVLIDLNPDYIRQQMERNGSMPLGLGAA